MRQTIPRGGGDPTDENGNDDKYDNDKEDEEDVMDILPSLLSCRVERLMFNMTVILNGLVLIELVNS